MSVQVTQGELGNILSSLAVFARRVVPGATALKVARIVGAVRAAHAEAEKERRALILEYVKRDDAGNPVSTQQNGNEVFDIQDDKKVEFDARVDLIGADRVELEIKKLTENEIRAIEIEPGALVNLLAFIEESAAE